MRKGEMTRQQIIDTIGATFLVTNLETGEYSYPKALKSVGKNYKKFLVGHPDKEHKFADIKFESDKLVVLVETKDKFTKKNVADGMGQMSLMMRMWIPAKRLFARWMNMSTYISAQGTTRSL